MSGEHDVLNDNGAQYRARSAKLQGAGCTASIRRESTSFVWS